MTHGFTKKELYGYSIIKWELIIKNDGNHTLLFPQVLRCLRSGCGFCEYYITFDECPSGIPIKSCGECPLKTAGLRCCSEFVEWCDNSNYINILSLAKLMLERVQSEYTKVYGEFTQRDRNKLILTTDPIAYNKIMKRRLEQ